MKDESLYKVEQKLNVLFLGGTRYFGRAAYQLILQNNRLSRIATLSRSENANTDGEHYLCDRKDSEALNRVFQVFKPDVLVDMINFDKGDSKGIVEAYNKGILNRLKHYIVISSFFVYNYFDYHEFRESELDLLDISYRESDGYTYRKLEMENVLYQSDLMAHTSILRLPFVFSSDDYSGRFQTICELSRMKEDWVFQNDYKFAMVSKLHAARGIEYLTTRSPMGIIDFANVGSVNNKRLTKLLQFPNLTEQDENVADLRQPYAVDREICIYTDKINLREDLVPSLKTEARYYFANDGVI